jgi:hypothetical protein
MATISRKAVQLLNINEIIKKVAKVETIFKGIKIELTPEKLILAQGEGTRFYIYLAQINGVETSINDATVEGFIIRPDGIIDDLNFTFVGNGRYKSDYYVFNVIGEYEVRVRVYSTVGNFTTDAVVNVMSGGIRALFPIGFNITPTPTLDFTYEPKEFLVLLKDEKEIINLTIKNNEKFNLIILANTFLDSPDNLYKIIIPPKESKTFRFMVKVKERCIEKDWIISLYIRGGLEVKGPINRVDVPVKAFTICPDGTYPPKAIELLESMKKKREIERLEILRRIQYLIFLTIGFAIVSVIIYYKYENLKEYVVKLREKYF